MSRILVVTSSPPFVEGGHLVITRSLVQALRERGHDAELVITPSNRFGRQASAYVANWMTDVGQLVVRDVRDRLFGHILGQSAAFFARRTSGQLLSRVTSDVTQIQQAVSETVGDLLREGLALVGYLILLFYYDPRLALLCLTSAPIIVYPLVRLGQKVRRSSKRSQEHLETLSQTFYMKHRVGDLMARATNDIGAVRMMIGPALMYALGTGVTIALIFPLMLRISVSLTLLSLCTLPFVSISTSIQSAWPARASCSGTRPRPGARFFLIEPQSENTGPL